MMHALALGIGVGGRVPAAGFSRGLRLLVIGDSQSAGRGAGTGSVAMDGARALSWPTKLAEALVSGGRLASMSSFMGDANNTGGSLTLYDPRIALANWSVAASGTCIGGKLVTKQAATTAPGAFSFTPTEAVDTFEVWTPRESYGSLSANVDGGTGTTIAGTGSSAFIKTVISTTLGVHTLNIDKVVGATIGFIVGVVAYNSAARDVRIINAGSRSYTTTDWLVQDKAWRHFPGIAALEPDIALIMLGVNDFRASGPLNPLATFAANMQTIIDQCVSAGAVVGLVLPQPVSVAEEGSFTQAQMLSTYQSLASTNSVPLYRTDTLLGTWEAANAAGETSDALHWKAPAHATLGAALVPMVTQLAAVA